jgi:hypothetical protein
MEQAWAFILKEREGQAINLQGLKKKNLLKKKPAGMFNTQIFQAK